MSGCSRCINGLWSLIKTNFQFAPIAGDEIEGGMYASRRSSTIEKYHDDESITFTGLLGILVLHIKLYCGSCTLTHGKVSVVYSCAYALTTYFYLWRTLQPGLPPLTPVNFS